MVAKVEWHQGELFPRVGFIVTNMSASPEGGGALLRPPRDGGAVDQRGQVRPQLDPAVLPQVRGQQGAAGSVHPASTNFGNFILRLALPRAVRHWSLRNLQVKSIEIGGRLVSRVRRLVFQPAEVTVPRSLFQGVPGARLREVRFRGWRRRLRRVVFSTKQAQGARDAPG